MPPVPSRRRRAGFTLIELMVTVAVVAILSAIAYASYSYAVVKSRRSAAAACLQERAQFMERYYTTNLSYAGAPTPAQCEAVPAFYTLAFDGTPTATAFRLIATPLGGQASADTRCAVLGLNQAG
ncbi:type IV pilin protein, partial [Xanthomonas sp. Kuri4-3]